MLFRADGFGCLPFIFFFQAVAATSGSNKLGAIAMSGSYKM